MTLDLLNLLQAHPYPAMVLGSIIEGEVTAVMSGYFAHQSHVSWPAIAAFLALCNFVVDQTYFMIGQRYGAQLVPRFTTLRSAMARITPHIQRHRRWFTVGVRFMVGLRTVGPIVLGMAKIPAAEFVLFNALGALVWAALFTGLGYVFGQAMATQVASLADHQLRALLVVIGVALLYFLARQWKANRTDPEQ
ncbi:MAG: DedA family protein [Burkholderiales bacterium]|nr:DedA family protein [Burkholderiales bacterium]